MIMQKEEKDAPLCMSRAEASFNMNNRPHILMNCYDAIL